jgi:hypothetical protein
MTPAWWFRSSIHDPQAESVKRSLNQNPLKSWIFHCPSNLNCQGVRGKGSEVRIGTAACCSRVTVNGNRKSLRAPGFRLQSFCPCCNQPRQKHFWHFLGLVCEILGMRWVQRVRELVDVQVRGLLTIGRQVQDAKILAAKALISQMVGAGALDNIQAAEFKVFSQFGEDGIIQYLIRRAQVPAEGRIFVEFGVESYEEANTRFLLLNDNWRGLIMDGASSNMRRVRNSSIYWRHNLIAVNAFIDADNINDLIRDAGISGQIGLLSIDIDGNDYWVWERIDVVSPILVVAEYNSVFGSRHAVTVPYDKDFDRGRAHSSNLYWGASLRALVELGNRKGYAFVGSNNAGNNAFFVRRDHLNGQRELTAAEGYVESQFRESRDEMGSLTFLSGPARLQKIVDLPVYDVERNAVVRLSDLI